MELGALEGTQSRDGKQKLIGNGLNGGMQSKIALGRDSLGGCKAKPQWVCSHQWSIAGWGMYCNPSGHPRCGILWDNWALPLPGGVRLSGFSCDPFSLQEKTSAERQKILGGFEGLRLFLEEQEHHLLAQLENMERDVEKTQEENVTILTKEISHLDTIIQEMEEKCQQPASKFLQVRRWRIPLG